ncbi:F510_1955 family glycosylhydrolase [Planococcus lenghuensis]|uniref:Beta-barrel assembly machine subunit BamC n=1 Tax=Planococcus lenghuensis TaxID=2213202 RepID=A0A1Q2KYF4_9BACL|nr:hypothetical protein [Planococcus lenghuensis]AQQ53240.1 hypothetical protein B0X71_09220 [Planococcus lenghuensis]
MKKKIFGLLITLSAAMLAACSGEEVVENETVEAVAEDGTGNEVAEGAVGEATAEASDVELMHIHGLGFSGDGAGIYVPSHDGLKVFEDGDWREAAVAANDYMGFSMVDDGFYSSGHPGEGSNLENPFGIVKSTDMGESLETLDLYKEVDFHLMDAGYYSHAIYVLNPQPNSRMDETGIYYSVDDTETWTESAAKGLAGEHIMSIAVHPKEEAVVAIATDQGVFLSEDYGQTFETISEVPATAAAFSPDGTLLVGGVADSFTLVAFDLETGEQAILPIPELAGQNAIGYIAVNPQDEQMITFATFEKDVYLSEDSGDSWNQIADKGAGLNLNE